MGNAARPYDVRPSRLYTRDDLMQGWQPGANHSMTLDGRIYAYVKAHGGRAPDVDEGLAQRTHDHFIDVALAAFLMRTGQQVVGVMGGSRTVAADPNYRRVVRLTAELTRRGYLVVGGGGRGIMEAANLGAYLANVGDADREAAVDALAAAPPYAEDRAAYIGAEVDIRERFAPGGESLAIPTWVNPRRAHQPVTASAARARAALARAGRTPRAPATCGSRPFCRRRNAPGRPAR
jgi:hypothetical protein